MIDFKTENVVSMSQAAKLLPRLRDGKKTHASTIFRWTQKGLKGIVLESIQIGRTRCTSEEALGRFFQRLTEVSSPPKLSTLPRTPAQRRRAIEKVEREIEELSQSPRSAREMK